MNVSPLPLSCKEHSPLNPVFHILFLFTILNPLLFDTSLFSQMKKRTEIADDFTQIFDKEAISTSKRLVYSNAKCLPQ